jgi:hypothetical protein
MKQIVLLLLCACFLAGCKSPQAYETMTDLYYEPEVPAPAQVKLWLPETGALNVLENEETGTLYLCDGYSVTVQTMAAGDMNATLCAATGYDQAQLHGIGWVRNGVERYECAWTSAGETGDQIGRTVVLDDGAYHYVVTVMGQAELAGSLAETWADITDSVALDTVP